MTRSITYEACETDHMPAIEATVLHCKQNEYTEFAKCITCERVRQHDMHESGTTHLIHHTASHGACDKTLDVKRWSAKDDYLRNASEDSG